MEWARLVPELSVTDIDTSLDFYIRKLGFSIKYGRPEDGFAYLDKEGAQIMLEQASPDNRWQTGELQKPFGRGINFQIEVNDVDSLYQEAQKQDIQIFNTIEEKWYQTGDVMGGVKQFLIQDPDGYLLRFFNHLGDKSIESK